MTANVGEQAVALELKNPITSEEEYKAMWEKSPMVANILLFLTENMDENGEVYFESYDKMTEMLSLRFRHLKEYRWKMTIN